MKIGEFCRQFDISEHTVRFYVKKGLLVPETRNKQYVFNDASVKDMGMILRLKEDGFTLGEIHRVVSLSRISGFAAEEDRMRLQRLYEKKYAQVSEQLQETLAAESTIKQLIQELEGTDAD